MDGDLQPTRDFSRVRRGPRHCLAGICLLSTLWGAPAASSGTAQAFREQTHALHDDLTALDKAWYRNISKLEAAGRPTLLRLKLNSAVFGKPLEVAIYRYGNEWIRALG